MDCNKDEAVKAMEIAEKKMESKDFIGAKKFFLKAQQLYSDLESISQMLTICNVHCAAEQRVMDNDMDWYGILQLEVKTDEVSIKKQYRKLALQLHPDKNKLAGAEAAFKLIGQAHGVLSDRLKRSTYDNKYKAFKEGVKFPQPRQNSTFPVHKQPGLSNSFGNISRPQFTSVNLHREPDQPGPDKPTFWTICPFCTMRYQYYRDILNRALRCQNCMKPYIAYDLNIQGVPSGANSTQPAVPEPKKVSQDGRKTAASASIPNRAGTPMVNKRSKNKAEEDGNVTNKTQSRKKHKFEADTHKAGKKSAESEEESSESCDSESSTSPDEYEIPEDIIGSMTMERSSRTRRSSRQKRQVIYNEDSDDDFVGSRGDKVYAGVEDQSEASLNGGAPISTETDGFVVGDVQEDEGSKKQKKGAACKESSSDGNVQGDPSMTNGKEAASVEDSEEISDIDEKLQNNSSQKSIPDPEFIEVADPDFYIFDNDRNEDCFATDQMWAIYDNTDGMPRFYARIRKVFSPGFKVKITWLEPSPDHQDEINWVKEELPVSCGMFKYGKSLITGDMNMFSHLVTYEKSARRSSLMIYPRKGETWALFKTWDINWSSDPDSHKNFEFDFVEILSDYVEECDISVACLEKVKGFVSLFQRKKGVASFQVPPNVRYRFSHMVPSYRTTGKERDGVPEGCFELDPASLPANLVDPKGV